MVLKKSFIDRLKVNHDSESEFVSKKIFFFWVVVVLVVIGSGGCLVLILIGVKGSGKN